MVLFYLLQKILKHLRNKNNKKLSSLLLFLGDILALFTVSRTHYFKKQEKCFRSRETSVAFFSDIRLEENSCQPHESHFSILTNSWSPQYQEKSTVSESIITKS